MKKLGNRKAFYLLVFGFLSASTVLASGGSDSRKIQNIHQRECSANNQFEITFTTDHANPDRCTNARTVTFSCTDSRLPNISSIALAAMMAEKKVWMWLSECNGSGLAKGYTIRLDKD